MRALDMFGVPVNQILDRDSLLACLAGVLLLGQKISSLASCLQNCGGPVARLGQSEPDPTIGIANAEGDALRLCLALDTERERPGEGASRADPNAEAALLFVSDIIRLLLRAESREHYGSEPFLHD